MLTDAAQSTSRACVIPSARRLGRPECGCRKLWRSTKCPSIVAEVVIPGYWRLAAADSRVGSCKLKSLPFCGQKGIMAGAPSDVKIPLVTAFDRGESSGQSGPHRLRCAFLKPSVYPA
jgi:hypothetical protein